MGRMSSVESRTTRLQRRTKVLFLYFMVFLSAFLGSICGLLACYGVYCAIKRLFAE